MHVAEQISHLLRRPTRLGVLAAMLGGSLALTAMNLPVYAHSRIHTASATIQLQARSVVADGHHAIIPFRPQSFLNRTAAPAGWGQVEWSTAMVAWAWTQPPENGGFLEHTTTGGKTWAFWYTPRIDWSQVAATGAQSVSLLGQRVPNPNALHPHPPLIWLHTTNGGKVWTRWMLTSPPLGHSISTTAIFPRTGFQALGVSQDGYLWWTRTGTRWHTLWPSADRVITVAPISGGGEVVAVETPAHMTWVGTVTIPSSGPVVIGAWHLAPASVQGMDWLNRQDGWMWSASQVWNTTDGGQIWNALGRIPGMPRAPGATLYMTSETEGYATAGQYGNGPPWDATELWSTNNGGHRWKRVTLPAIFYRFPNGFKVSLIGFYVTAIRAHTLTLWYGPITQQGVPQRVWTSDQGKTWHGAKNNPPEPY